MTVHMMRSGYKFLKSRVLRCWQKNPFELPLLSVELERKYWRQYKKRVARRGEKLFIGTKVHRCNAEVWSNYCNYSIYFCDLFRRGHILDHHLNLQYHRHPSVCFAPALNAKIRFTTSSKKFSAWTLVSGDIRIMPIFAAFSNFM